jgi:hypothetical protein
MLNISKLIKYPTAYAMNTLFIDYSTEVNHLSPPRTISIWNEAIMD